MGAEQPDKLPGRVVVVGSANVDTTLRVGEFPHPGQTVLASAGEAGLGGKGANQAVAAALLGVDVEFIGSIGSDAHGLLVQDELRSFGVDTSATVITKSAPTGAAYILVSDTAENMIVVVPGANSLLSPDVLEGARPSERLGCSDPGATVGLAQGEVPASVTARFAQHCREAGVRFVLNLAPAVTMPAETLTHADPLVVNEGESAQILGLLEADIHEPLKVVARLAQEVSQSAVITLGAKGAVASDGHSSWQELAPQVAQVVDTTGAGDAFVGALAAALAKGATLAEAVRVGVQAGSSAVQERGTTASYRAMLPQLAAARWEKELQR